jgi:hypothetical protein
VRQQHRNSVCLPFAGFDFVLQHSLETELDADSLSGLRLPHKALEAALSGMKLLAPIIMRA